MDRRTFLAASLAAPFAGTARAEPAVSRLLYVVCPGIRDYLEFGGAGILVFDIDNGHKFVKRIATDASKPAKPRNIKGVVASAATKKLYFTTPESLYCVDLVTEKTVWGKELPQGCDRLATTPDGKTLYVPSFEKDIWNVVDAATGKVTADIETKSGAHNTVCGLDGTRVYLAGLKSPLPVRRGHEDAQDRRQGRPVRRVDPAVHGQRRADALLRERQRTARLRDRRPEDRQEAAPRRGAGVQEGAGEAARLPEPRHRPDAGREGSLGGGRVQQRVHVFDATVMPPKYVASVKLREQPGWVTFSLDGKYAYPSTGEVIDTATKKIVTALTDEKGGPVHSEKMVEIHFKDGMPVAAGDQFGLGTKEVVGRPFHVFVIADERARARPCASQTEFTPASPSLQSRRGKVLCGDEAAFPRRTTPCQRPNAFAELLH